MKKEEKVKSDIEAESVIEEYPHFLYSDGTLADNDVIRCMTEYHAQQLKAYQDKLIEELEELKMPGKYANYAIDEAIDLIKSHQNS